MDSAKEECVKLWDMGVIMVDLDAIKVVLQRVDKGLECSDTLVATARDQLKLVEEKFTSHNKQSTPCYCSCHANKHNEPLKGGNCHLCGCVLE